MSRPPFKAPQSSHAHALGNATFGGESSLQARHSTTADRGPMSGTRAVHLPLAVPLDATRSAGSAPESWTTPATPTWSPPLGSSTGPSQQAQRQGPCPGGLLTNTPYRSLFLDAQARGNTFSQTPDLGLQNTLVNAPNISAPAQASALLRRSTQGQNTCVSSALSDQRIGETNRATFEGSPARLVPAPLMENSGSPVQGLLAGYGLVPSLTVPIPNDSVKPCVCNSKSWFAWCPRAMEHYTFAILYSPWFIHYPCLCGWALSTPQLPRCCPKAASHLLDWLCAPKNIRLSQVREFENAFVNDSIAPWATYNNLQDTAVENVAPPYRSTYDPGTQESRGSDTNNSTRFPHTPPLLFAPPFTLGTPVPTRETSHPTDLDQNPHLAGVASGPTLADPTLAGSDVGPSRNRNLEAEVGAEDEGHGFGDTDLPPKVQQAMRLLVGKIRLSPFFTNQAFEPALGTLEASALMAVAPSELWIGYGTKGKSIYSLFIRVDGEDCECLWCGDVQHGKLLRAIGHFRVKHLRHKPFTCDLTHAEEKVCHARFPTLEAMKDHQKKKEKQQEHGKLPCTDCGHSYVSTSNLNRHNCVAKP